MAVALLVVIATVLAWGTIYEARFGTAAVQQFVYHSWWFQGLLSFLAVNLAAAALERWPWQRKHLPFLLAHLGIILILVGGILGSRLGLAGQLIIPEGQAERMLQLPTNVLVINEPNPGVARTIPVNFEATAWVHDPHASFHVPIADRSIAVTVDRYYPDAVVEETVSDDAVEENPAVHVVMSQGEEQDEAWLFARDPERFGMRWGKAHLLFLEPATASQLQQFLGLFHAEAGAERGVVTIELPDLKVRTDIPVPQDVTQPIAIPGTPYAVTFKEYFTDLAITEHGVVNRSAEPNNPAVALTLSGPEGVDPWLVFALHPEFPAIHGQRRVIHAQITYAHATRSLLPPNAICLIRHPAGALSCVLTGSAGEQVLEACDIGTRYTHPWLGYQFEITAHYPHARIMQQFTNRSDEVHVEALHLMLQDGSASAHTWLRMRETAQLSLGAHPVTVEYRPAQQDLPFTVKLLDFRKTDYPGTNMAASFESDVELTDSQRGVILMRTIRMNTPLRYRGFSLYQSSYVAGPTETTVLSVRSDPGTPLVYAGFIIVILGVVAMFVLRSPTASAQGEIS